MAGGGGGGTYVSPVSNELRRKIEEAQAKDRQRLDGDINALLNDLLATFNDRDIDAVKQKLEQLHDVLGDEIEVDQVLLGGSVAKHTAVDGLSDVDALVILNRAELQGKSPEEMLTVFYKTINDSLPRANVAEITKGTLAVTVKYDDGSEIQLLPALRTKKVIAIAAQDGKTWNETKPKVFQKALSSANAKMNQALVPAIKLFKSLNADFPQQKQLSSYHIEALAVDATKKYKGPNTPKALLLHIIDHAADRIMRPIQDKTSQSRTVDAYLGKPDSIARLNVAQTLLGLRRRLESAGSISQWRAVFGVKP